MSETVDLLRSALSSGEGVLRLAPAWVPRSFLMPGGRLKLHPSDIYALGAHRGGIDERWFSSTTNADNGPGTPDDEGLSYIVASNDAPGPRKVLLKTAVEEIGDEILGSDVMSAHGGWNVLCKFFDNLGPRSPTTCTKTRKRPRAWGGAASPRHTTSRPSTTTRRTTSPTPSWAWSRARPRTMSGAAWSAGTRATTASFTTPRPTS